MVIVQIVQQGILRHQQVQHLVHHVHVVLFQIQVHHLVFNVQKEPMLQPQNQHLVYHVHQEIFHQQVHVNAKHVVLDWNIVEVDVFLVL